MRRPGSAVTVDNGGCCGVIPFNRDLKPQTVNETSGGIGYEARKDLVLGLRGIYRAQGTVIEDASLDEGETFFLFNPGEGSGERLACATPFGCFGRARRYYRGSAMTEALIFVRIVHPSVSGKYRGTTSTAY
jgi:hypothetical protein